MEDPPPQNHPDSAETPNQKQARLRRERREAKLKAEGSSRLEKISKVSGRQNLPDPPPNIGQVSADPDEVDLSTHPSATVARTPPPPFTNNNNSDNSNGQNGPPTEADIRALLRAGAPQPGVERSPGAGEGGHQEEEDPMMKMLAQLMGGGGAGEGGGGLPPGLAAMLGGGGNGGGVPGLGGQQPQVAEGADTYAYLWRIVHAVFALALGVWATNASGAVATIGKGPRGVGVVSGEQPVERQRVNVFFVFATAELVLQSSRFFVERGKGSGQFGGWIGVVAGLAPEPYRVYLRLVGRYARILGTVVEDAMVVVFVVGGWAWWKGVEG